MLCNSWSAEDGCESDREHPGYGHADLWSEVQAALDAGEQDVFDSDGDFVVGIERIVDDEGGAIYFWGKGAGRNKHESITPHFILIPVKPLKSRPVVITQEEMDAAMKSLSQLRMD